jgi:hypothetical protein
VNGLHAHPNVIMVPAGIELVIVPPVHFQPLDSAVAVIALVAVLRMIARFTTCPPVSEADSTTFVSVVKK